MTVNNTRAVRSIFTRLADSLNGEGERPSDAELAGCVAFLREWPVSRITNWPARTATLTALHNFAASFVPGY